MTNRVTFTRKYLESIADAHKQTLQKRRKKLFEKVRDIPFAIRLELFDPSEAPEKMLVAGAGFCIPKHLLLGELFERMGHEIKWVVHAFNWKDMPISYSGYLAEQVQKLPVTYHLSLEAKFSGSWKNVDATWDSALLKTDLPVNRDWDGDSATDLAVSSLGFESFEDIDALSSEIKREMDSYSLSEKLRLNRFSLALNRYLSDIRNNSKT